MEVSRRTVIGAGVGAAGLLALGAGGGFWLSQLGRTSGGYTTGNANAGWATEPERMRSTNGRLAIDLTAAPTTVDINGAAVQAWTYNGSLPGPTWVAHPGDVITVNFTNQLPETTNLHTHGFHVSPDGNSDNVFVEVQPGESFTYEYRIPDDHPLGTYWYHPHHHGMAANQVFAGLYGAILITAPTGTVTAYDPADERTLVISDITFDGSGVIASPSMMQVMMGREGQTIMVNGQVQPTYAAPTAGAQRVRLVNSCTSRYLNLHFGGESFTLLGLDSGTYATPKTVTNVIIAPGNRAHIEVAAGSTGAAGTPSRALLYDTVPHPDNMMSTPTVKNFALATFAPDASADALALGASGASAAASSISTVVGTDLRTLPVAAQRGFVLSMPGMGSGNNDGMGMMGGMGQGNGMGQMNNGMTGFTINGASFDPAVINTTVAFDTVEEWTIQNATNMAHPFHLHVWPMQVVRVGPNAIEGVEYQDVVNVPANGRVTVRVSFGQFSGTAVYHCHILDHEDSGMMAIIDVV